eukprot:gene12957-15226_t
MKRCPNAVSLKEQQPRYCLTHKHTVETQLQKKRTLEDSSSSRKPQAKKLLTILAKHGINKGNYYQDYRANHPKKVAEKKVDVEDVMVPLPQPPSLVFFSSSQDDGNVPMSSNRLPAHQEESVDTKDFYFLDRELVDKEYDGLMAGDEPNTDLIEAFDENYFLSQTTFLTEEELAQRRRMFVSKLILLYKKQYIRMKERLRLLRRHYIQSVEEKELSTPPSSTSTTTTSTSTTKSTTIECYHSNCTTKPVPLSKFCFARKYTSLSLYLGMLH